MGNYKFNQINLREFGEADNTVEYFPNESVKIGGGFYYKSIGIAVTLRLPVSDAEKENKGDTRTIDTQVNLYTRAFNIDAFQQFYSGYYLNNHREVMPSHQQSFSNYPIREDLRMINYGINFTYVFNHKRFSYRSAYLLSERQARSAGSFLLGSSFSGIRTRGDSSFTNTEIDSISGYTGMRFNEVRALSFGITAGYTRTFVIKRNFFINGSIQLGPVINFARLRDEENNADQQADRVGLKSLVRFAAGYNHPKFYGGFTALNDSYNIDFDDLTFSYSVGSIRLFIGKRFQLGKPLRLFGREI